MFSNTDIYLAGKNSICLDSGKQIYMNSQKINLGLQADQSGVLGNKLQDVLNNIYSILKSHQKQLLKISNHVHPTAAAGTPTLPSSTISYSKSTFMDNLKSKIKNILSKIVKLK